MKVLHLNTSASVGGAAIAARRLVQSLQRLGVDATLLCRDVAPEAADAGVKALPPSLFHRLRFVAERAEIYVRNGFTREGLFAIDLGRFGQDVTKLPVFREADLIHLHWVNQAMLSLSDIRRILRSGKPVVWTMHDMWPFVGLCHHTADCERWKNGCGKCPLLRKPSPGDLSAQTYHRKEKAYGLSHFHLVGCSKWLADLAAEAPLLKHAEISSIPNPIDTDFYSPVENAEELKAQLGIPADKKVLLFTAFKVSDPKKGVDYLMEALTHLHEQHPDFTESLVLVLAGKGCEEVKDAFPVQTVPMGYVTEPERMRDLYRCADLLLMPSLMDNLPNTIVEAMACGVPCVGFRVGGITQMIDMDINGYLSDYCDSLDLAKGILTTLNSPSYPAMSRNARSKSVSCYSEKTVAERYLALYRQLLKGSPENEVAKT